MKGKSILLSVLLIAIISCSKENEVRVPAHLQNTVSAIACKEYITDKALFIPFDDDYYVLKKLLQLKSLPFLPTIRALMYGYSHLKPSTKNGIRK